MTTGNDVVPVTQSNGMSVKHINEHKEYSCYLIPVILINDDKNNLHTARNCLPSS